MTSFSIIIPSYNNAKVLKETLDSIFNDIQSIREKSSFFEVLLCDNISTDNTYEVIQPFLEQYPEMKYRLNKQHICGSSNIISSATKAKGEYVILMGDDLFHTNAIVKILDTISNNNPDMILLGTEVWTEDLEHSLRFDEIGKNNGWISSLAIHRLHDLGFFGNMIIKRNIWEDSTKCEDLYTTFFPHAFVFLRNIDQVKTYRIYDFLATIQRNGKRTEFFHLLVRVDYVNMVTKIFRFIQKENQKKFIKNIIKSEFYLTGMKINLLKTNIFLRLYIIKKVLQHFKCVNLKFFFYKITLVSFLLIPQILVPFAIIMKLFIRMIRINIFTNREIHIIQKEMPQRFNVDDI
jgi:glycosyltransferase involved in cell wall biosynthesis